MAMFRTQRGGRDADRTAGGTPAPGTRIGFFLWNGNPRPSEAWTGHPSLRIGYRALRVEVEGVEQIVKGRAVGRHVRVVLGRLRVGVIVATAGCQRREAPVAFDELGQRNVVGIAVIDVSTLCEGRHDDQRSAGAVAEKVQGLDVAGIIVATTLVKGDEDRGARPGFRIGLNRRYDLLHEAFKQVEFRGGRVTVDKSAGLDD